MHKGLLQLIKHTDGWVVGSSAKPVPPDCCDIDILIPFNRWALAMRVFRGFIQDFKPNSLGGWRGVIGKEKVDIWPDTLDRYCKRKKVGDGYLWNPLNNVRIYVERLK